MVNLNVFTNWVLSNYEMSKVKLLIIFKLTWSYNINVFKFLYSWVWIIKEKRIIIKNTIIFRLFNKIRFLIFAKDFLFVIKQNWRENVCSPKRIDYNHTKSISALILFLPFSEICIFLQKLLFLLGHLNFENLKSERRTVFHLKT